MIRRLAVRTLILTVLILLCLSFMEFLTRATNTPEIMQIMAALAKVAAADMGILWIRLAISPKQDVQRLANKIENQYDRNAYGYLYLSYTITWAVRFGAFLWLLEH